MRIIGICFFIINHAINCMQCIPIVSHRLLIKTTSPTYLSVELIISTSAVILRLLKLPMPILPYWSICNVSVLDVLKNNACESVVPKKFTAELVPVLPPSSHASPPPLRATSQPRCTTFGFLPVSEMAVNTRLFTVYFAKYNESMRRYPPLRMKKCCRCPGFAIAIARQCYLCRFSASGNSISGCCRCPLPIFATDKASPCRYRRIPLCPRLWMNPRQASGYRC